MSQFDFLYVLISAIVAIALTNMAYSWSALLRRRAEVRFYWIHAAWSVLIAMITIQIWWTVWRIHSIDDWSFFETALVVGEMLVLVMATAVITPSRRVDGPIDLQVLFYEISPAFFTLCAVLMFVLTLVNLIIMEQHLLHFENVIRAIAISIAMVGAMTRSTLVHTILVSTGFALLLFFIVMQVAR